MRRAKGRGASEETFEEIAAGVAHEIKNPLALAMANISLIKLGDSERKYSKQCSVIENELEKINEMVVELVISARSARSGQIGGADEVLDAAEVLAGVIGEFEAANASLVFGTRGFDEKRLVRGDRRRLAMVFSNIIKNASEAQNGCGRIDVSIEGRSPGSARDGVRIVFDDYGEGLSESDLENVGKRYYSTKRNGTGLGVLFCRNSMEQCGGSFGIGNRVDGNEREILGCRVTLEFPGV